ncbi:MAG: nucleotidyltransferase family protein [Clostridia bacterium]|nr:nucleotidyltransferase family protein [Clostridia bacterium]
MSQNTFTKTETTILSALSNGLCGEKYLAEKDTDWQEVLKESKAQSVCLAVFDALSEESDICANVHDEFELISAKQISQNMTVHSYHKYLHNLMEQNGIDYCVIKGSSSAYYYKNPLLRAMGDVDFLVKAEDLEKAKKVLLEDGFSLYMEKHASHIVLRKGKMHFEMHFSLPGMPEGKYGESLKTFLSDIFEKSETVTIEGLEFKTPSAFHHGLILLMHTYHHMLGEGVGLRHLCDIAFFINSFKEYEFEETFKEKLQICGLWHFAKILAHTCYKYLGIQKKAFMTQDLDSIAEEVMKDIFAGGNFGRKDKERASQSLAISDRGKDGIGKSAHLQFIKSLNSAAKVQFPFIKRHKILHPFGFIALGTRRCFRVLKGTRKMPELKGAIKGANIRKEIYSQFRLFEGEDK